MKPKHRTTPPVALGRAVAPTIRDGKAAPPAGDIEQAMEALQSAIARLRSSINVLHDRLHPVLTSRPDGPPNPGTAIRAGHCPLSDTLYTRADEVDNLMQVVDGILADLQL
jgi:hypothetical protein